MAIMTIRSTYSLDVDTVRMLERIAQQWQVSKSEALRRAIRAAAEGGSPPSTEALQALDRLQDSLRLTPAAAEAWQREARDERRAGSRRREQV